jgi:hypothetical protein
VLKFNVKWWYFESMTAFAGDYFDIDVMPIQIESIYDIN